MESSKSMVQQVFFEKNFWNAGQTDDQIELTCSKCSERKDT